MFRTNRVCYVAKKPKCLSKLVILAYNPVVLSRLLRTTSAALNLAATAGQNAVH